MSFRLLIIRDAYKQDRFAPLAQNLGVIASLNLLNSAINRLVPLELNQQGRKLRRGLGDIYDISKAFAAGKLFDDGVLIDS